MRICESEVKISDYKNYRNFVIRVGAYQIDNKKVINGRISKWKNCKK